MAVVVVLHFSGGKKEEKNASNSSSDYRQTEYTFKNRHYPDKLRERLRQIVIRKELASFIYNNNITTANAERK